MPSLSAYTDVSPRIGRGRGIARAVLGWAVMCTGIGLSITLSRFITGWFDAPAVVLAILQAVLVTALVVPAIVLLRRRGDRRTLSGLGLSKRIGRPVALGVGVALVCAAVVWIPAFVSGWIRLESLDVSELLVFVLVNTVVLFLYEALPEELALRGYAWTNIRDSWAPLAATLIVTVLFTLSATLISVVQTASAILMRTETFGISFAPPGNDPLVYFIQLFVFGLALIAARRIPIAGALTIAIAFHIAQLTVTRFLLGGTSWLSSGANITFVAPDAIALVLVHIMLSGCVFLAIRVWLTAKQNRPSTGVTV